MYEVGAPKVFVLKKTSKGLYYISSKNGVQLTTEFAHDSEYKAYEWAVAWASSWPNTTVEYEG
jgi:hypothetical protein